MALGRVGIWTHALDALPWSRAREIVLEIEELGYGALWLPEAVNREAMTSAALTLDATTRLTVATGIVSIYARYPTTLNAAWQTLTEAFPERFLLGIGVSHQSIVEGVHKVAYAPPVEAMRQYLDGMDSAPFFAARPTTPPRRVLAALGPKMLALAAERADGAHPYHATPAHTATAREILGGDKMLAVEQPVLLAANPDEARRVARAALAIYLTLPNYVNNWTRLGFTDDDFADGGSDRFVDAIVAWGDEQAIKARVDEHLDAGADHVCIQVLTSVGGPPVDEWHRLAPVLV
jgi:probable F420-dependent oxidoreductase